MLSDRITQALAALRRGELPDPADRAALVEACNRAAAGLSWRYAIGDAGPLAMRQRNAAIAAIAAWHAPHTPGGNHQLAARVVETLEHPPPGPPAALRDTLDTAARLRAGDLCRQRVFQILNELDSTPPEQNPAPRHFCAARAC